MKILFTTSRTVNNYHFSSFFEDEEIIFGEVFQNKFPSEKSISYAHELLSFCLDQGIQRVYATREGELNLLSEAKVLFAEFEIEVIVPTLNQIFSINNFQYEVDSFASLSTQLLSAGYPKQKLALGKADLRGDLLIIDDEIKDFNQVWSKMKSVSFTQLGKLFNQSNFDLLNIYQLSENLKESNILFKNGQTYFFETVDPSLALVIDLMLKQNNCLGFYQVYYNGHQILRIKNVAL